MAKHLQNLFTRRFPGNASVFIGEAGRMFYDEITGNLRLSDGITPGGLSVFPSSNANITFENNGNLNSSQNILNLVAGEQVTLVDLGNGAIQFNVTANVTTNALILKTNSVLNSSQLVLNLTNGNGISLIDNGLGNIGINISNPIIFETNGTLNSSQVLLNLTNGNGISLIDNGAGNISINVLNGMININERLMGTANSNNKIFTSNYSVITSQPYQLFYNGQLLTPFYDFTVTGNVWTYITFAPRSASIQQVFYTYL